MHRKFPENTWLSLDERQFTRIAGKTRHVSRLYVIVVRLVSLGGTDDQLFSGPVVLKPKVLPPVVVGGIPPISGRL